MAGTTYLGKEVIEKRKERVEIAPHAIKATYDIGGISGLGQDTTLEIKVEPVRKYLVFKRIKTTMTVAGEAVGIYRPPIAGERLPRAILTVGGEVVDVRSSKTISESIELTPDETGNVDSTTENRDKLYEMAKNAAYCLEINSGSNYAGIREVFEKCLEAETGLAPMRDYRRLPGQGPLTTFQKLKLELEIVNSGHEPPM